MMENYIEHEVYEPQTSLRSSGRKKRKRKEGVLNLLSFQLTICLVTAILLLFGNVFLPEIVAPIKAFYNDEILKESGEEYQFFETFKSWFSFEDASNKESGESEEQPLPEDTAKFPPELSATEIGLNVNDVYPKLFWESASFETISPNPLNTEFVVPIHGRISSGYGYRFHPVTGLPEFHKGIDIPAAEGTPIVSFRDGIVKKAEYSDSFGYYLVIEHKARTATRYGHCSSLLVQEGDRVKAGETVALSGNTGMSTGPHCHFDLSIDSVFVDPLTILPFDQEGKFASV